MSGDFENSLLDNDYEKIPSVSFRDAAVGQKLILRIEELPTKKIQRKKFGTDELMWWKLTERDNGVQKPMQNTFVRFTVLDGSDVWTQNAENDELDPAHEIGSEFNWWVNIPSQGLAEFQLKHKLLQQEAGDPKAYKSTAGRGKDIITLGPEYDEFRHGRVGGFRVGDVIELKFDSKKKITGQSPQKIYKITYLRSEGAPQPSIFDDADE